MISRRVTRGAQGIVTNDVLPLEAPGAPPMYACILNAQGRYLHDLFLHRTQDEVPTVMVDTDSHGKEDLLRLLKRYRLRQKIDIEDVSQQYRVWARFGGSEEGTTAERAAAAAAAEVVEPGAAGQPGWAPDPRLWQLGLRAVLPVGDGDGSGGGAGSSCWGEHRRWRIMQGVAEGDSEIPTGEVIPLEFNIDGLSGISFTKGCYVGQELMARTHFKGVVRKRLMPFRLTSGSGDSGGGQQQQAQASEVSSSSGGGRSEVSQEAAAGPVPAAATAGGSSSSGTSSSSSSSGQEGLQPGAAVYIEQPGGKRKSVGVVRVADGDIGLAVLRLASTEAARAAGQPLLVGEGEARVELAPWRPDWWPETWGREEQAA